MSIEPRSSPARGLLNAPPHWTAPTLGALKHGFFGREGGVSCGIYATLNAGAGSKDDPLAVQENRRRIAASFALEPSHLLGVHQVHSPRAVLVSAPWRCERPEADALVTTTPGVALSVLTADCAPVLLADHEAGVVAAAHAGWKGALSGVLEATIDLMRTHGARDIAAAIGPCIHLESYEVGPEFEARFVAADPTYAQFFEPGVGDRRRFDLPGFCSARLRAHGATAVEILPLDTYVWPKQLYSHRRSVHEALGDYGRNCSAIAL